MQLIKRTFPPSPVPFFVVLSFEAKYTEVSENDRTGILRVSRASCPLGLRLESSWTLDPESPAIKTTPSAEIILLVYFHRLN